MAAGRSLRLPFLFVFFVALVASTLADDIPAPAQAAKFNKTDVAGVMRGEEAEGAGAAGGGSSAATESAWPNRRMRIWCIAKYGYPLWMLQQNIDFACGSAGVDCGPIQPGRECFEPNLVKLHADYAMNAYYQRTGDCNFKGTGERTYLDPSYRNCHYPVNT